MPKKGKGRRAADEMRGAVKEIAAKRQAEAAADAPDLAVGNTYYDEDGNAYEVTAIKNEVITAKRGDKNIPFQMVMFEELVGLKDPSKQLENSAKGAEKAAVSKAAAEKAVADKATAEKAAVEEKKAQKEARKAAAGANGGRKVSGMRVIRDTLAKNPSATLEQVSEACTKAGVPKSDSTIMTIMSDFKQTYQALQDAGRIRVLH